MAKQAEAEREKRAKIIAAEGEFLSVQKLADAADVIAAHPIALQLRNLHLLYKIQVIHIQLQEIIMFYLLFPMLMEAIRQFRILILLLAPQ